jgi:transposase
MAKRNAVQTLVAAGHTQGETSALLGVSERSVRRISREPPVACLDDTGARRARGIGRPSLVEGYRERVEAWLKAEPDTAATELLRRASSDGYKGQKSAFFAMVASLRPAKSEAVVRFEAVPGEFCQHDFGHVDVRFTSGEKRRVRFFASRLKYSRMVAVSLVPDERVESVTRGVVDHYARFGGVPMVAVFDQPRTVVQEWDPATGRVIRWQPTFLDVMGQLGVAPNACWPHRPNQKGSVENLVGWVKGSFFKSRRFIDDEDLRRQLEAWHEDANTKRPCRATGEIPEARMATERPRLRPLGVTPDTLTLRFPVHVAATATVSFDGRVYSMPPQAIGIPATLYLGRDKVRIVAGRYDATHPRLEAPNARSTLPEHRAAMVAAANGSRGRLYLKRQHLLELDPIVLEFMTDLVHRRGHGGWSHDVEVMHALLELHGGGPLIGAIRRAHAMRAWSARAVASELGCDPAKMPLSNHGELH